MSIKLIRKSQYKAKRRIVANINERLNQFKQIELEEKEVFYKNVKYVEKHLAIHNNKIEVLKNFISPLFFFGIFAFFLFTHFYLSVRFNVEKPITVSLIYLIPSLLFSSFIFILSLSGKIEYFENTNLPITETISNVLKWVFISATVSAIGAFLFSPLLQYLILTPVIAGVGSGAIFVVFGVSSKFIVTIFWNGFHNKYPMFALIDMFIKILSRFNNDLSRNGIDRMILAQLLGDTGELMQKVLPKSISRIDIGWLVVELSDPYIIKLIERRVMEMSMTLRVFAKTILLGNDKQILSVHNKIKKNFVAVLEEDWGTYEVEKSDEINLLLETKPLASKFEMVLEKIKFVIIGLLPISALFILQNTKYTLPQGIYDSTLPFVITWALVSILNLIGADSIADRFLKAKGIAESIK